MKLKDLVSISKPNKNNGQIALHPSKRKMKEFGLTEEDILNSRIVKELNKVGTNE